MAHTNYYGKKQGTTFLDLYYEPSDGGERTIQHRLCDQDAYDTAHLAFLFKEILSCKRLMIADEVALSQLPRKEKSLLLYLILACRPAYKTVLELGSSLFELIDGLELVQKFFQTNGLQIPVIDIQGLSFMGVEISGLMRQASLVLHPQYSINLYEDVTKIDKPFQILYERNVSSYVFETSQELAGFISRSEVALMNLFVSKEETFLSSRYGKSLTYFSLKELVECLDKPLYHLFGEKAPGPFSGPELSRGRPVVEGFFLYCQPGFAEEFLAMARRDSATNAYFEEKQIIPKDALTLLER